jgi:hypothetical protein
VSILWRVGNRRLRAARKENWHDWRPGHAVYGWGNCPMGRIAVNSRLLETQRALKGSHPLA